MLGNKTFDKSILEELFLQRLPVNVLASSNEKSTDNVIDILQPLILVATVRYNELDDM